MTKIWWKTPGGLPVLGRRARGRAAWRRTRQAYEEALTLGLRVELDVPERRVRLGRLSAADRRRIKAAR